MQNPYYHTVKMRLHYSSKIQPVHVDWLTQYGGPHALKTFAFDHARRENQSRFRIHPIPQKPVFRRNHLLPQRSRKPTAPTNSSRATAYPSELSSPTRRQLSYTPTCAIVQNTAYACLTATPTSATWFGCSPSTTTKHSGITNP